MVRTYLAGKSSRLEMFQDRPDPPIHSYSGSTTHVRSPWAPDRGLSLTGSLWLVMGRIFIW